MEPKKISLIFLALCLFFAFSMSPAEAGNEKGKDKCNDGEDNDGDGKIDGKDEDCFGVFKNDKGTSGHSKDLPLIVTIDDVDGDNLQSDWMGMDQPCKKSDCPYFHKEDGMNVSAGGHIPRRINVGFRGTGNNPRELKIDVSCDPINLIINDENVTVGDCGVLTMDFPSGNGVDEGVEVQRANLTLAAIPYEICPANLGGGDGCPDVFTMDPGEQELMSFRISLDGGAAVIEVASDIGGANSVDAGRCLSLLTGEERTAFLAAECSVPSKCNVTVEAFNNVGNDEENDEWRIDANGVKALICSLGNQDLEPGVIGQTTLTFGFTAKKK